MTKTEFRAAARKAGVNPDLYGAVLSANLRSMDNGPISGGKIIGIVWKNAEKTERHYSSMRDFYTEKFLGSVPYVILRKNRQTFHVEVAQINAYLSGLFCSWLSERVRSGEPL